MRFKINREKSESTIELYKKLAGQFMTYDATGMNARLLG